MSPVRIGTRGSRLALWQASHVAELIRPLAASRGVEIIEIQTAGDQVRDRPLPEIGGEGVFTKEIQRALLAGTIDVAVHSLKDLPTVPVNGLVVAAIPERGPSQDAFVSLRYKRFDDLPIGAVLATGSPRRRAQALHRRPDLRLVDIRGNVETRLRKLAEQLLDGLVLAQAGLERLGLKESVTEVLTWMLPAVGQGALALECRADDRATHELLKQLDDPSTRTAVLAERALLRSLGGGCQVPIGVRSDIRGETIRLQAIVLSPDGRRRVEAEQEGRFSDAEGLGQRLANEFLSKGAGDLLLLQ